VIADSLRLSASSRAATAWLVGAKNVPASRPERAAPASADACARGGPAALPAATAAGAAWLAAHGPLPGLDAAPCVFREDKRIEQLVMNGQKKDNKFNQTLLHTGDQGSSASAARAGAHPHALGPGAELRGRVQRCLDVRELKLHAADCLQPCSQCL